MKLQLLHVPDCPSMALLDQRLAQALDGREDVQVDRRVVTDEQQAARLGMTGSPTVLVDGVDPFAEPGRSPSISCRLYRAAAGRLTGAPSVAALRAALTPPGRRA